MRQEHIEALHGETGNLEDALYRRGAHRVFLNGKFLDIGTPERLALARSILR